MNTDDNITSYNEHKTLPQESPGAYQQSLHSSFTFFWLSEATVALDGSMEKPGPSELVVLWKSVCRKLGTWT